MRAIPTTHLNHPAKPPLRAAMTDDLARISLVLRLKFVVMKK
jgi:hypothetical protein